MKIDLSPVDMQILHKHSPTVRGRALIELAIVDALIQAAQSAGYSFTVYEDEEEDVSDPDNLKLLLFNLDDAYLLVFGKDQEEIGWIRLIFGNDGFDSISDYTTNLEAFLAPAKRIADFWGG